VASVKPNTSGGRGGIVNRLPGGGFRAENIVVNTLIQLAYNVSGFQISGAPAWTSSDRFDVNAKAEGEATMDQMRPMLQAMLADRFRLMAHRETKEAPIYELVAAKSGLKLAPTKEGSCTTFDPKTPPPPPPRPGDPLPRMCGGARISRSSIDAFGISMAALASDLSNLLGRTVVDKTGVTGTFDVHMEFAPDEAIAIGGQAAPSADQAGPSIFTALQEQLGLKLDNAKSPVEVLVIDHVERPSEN